MKKPSLVNLPTMDHPLRARKKAATRQAISDAGTRLFEARGFDAVTLAEIADAANVSVKTVWNYFGTKDELFFDHEDEILDGLLGAIRNRPPGISPSTALQPLLSAPFLDLSCRWTDLDVGRYEQARAYYACEQASHTLSARRVAIIHSWTEPLANAGGSVPWAAMLTGVIALRHQQFASAFIAQRSIRDIQRTVRTTISAAIEALNRAFPELGDA
jgi:AcrR family transcriptional regulator